LLERGEEKERLEVDSSAYQDENGSKIQTQI